MDFYNYILEMLPPLYRTPNTLARYKVIASQMNKLFEEIKKLPSKYVIDTCENEELLVLGENVGVKKLETDSWETYRQLIAVEHYKLFNVPTHENIIKLVRKSTGFYPVLESLHYFGDSEENDQGYKLVYELPIDYNQKPLENVESFIGGGIKINREFLVSLDGCDIYWAQGILNDGVIKIGGV